MKLAENTDYLFFEKGSYGKQFDIGSQSQVAVLCTKEYLFIFTPTVAEFNAAMLFNVNKIRTLDGPVQMVKEVLSYEYNDKNDFHEKVKSLFKETKRKYVFEIAKLRKFKIMGFIAKGMKINDENNDLYGIGVTGSGAKAKLKAFYNK